MSSLNELRRFFAQPPQEASGTVVERIDADRYRISVGAGSIEAVATGGAAFKVGDEVLVRSGVILGRLKAISLLRVYTV